MLQDRYARVSTCGNHSCRHGCCDLKAQGICAGQAGLVTMQGQEREEEAGVRTTAPWPASAGPRTRRHHTTATSAASLWHRKIHLDGHVLKPDLAEPWRLGRRLLSLHHLLGVQGQAGAGHYRSGCIQTGGIELDRRAASSGAGNTVGGCNELHMRALTRAHAHAYPHTSTYAHILYTHLSPQQPPLPLLLLLLQLLLQRP